ncbi:hypothetical protein FB451DRAFT_1569650, partial [Mycena latifolia]
MPPFAYYAAVPSPTQSYPLDVSLHCVLSTVAHRLAPGLLFACIDSYPNASSSVFDDAFSLFALGIGPLAARADGATQTHIDNALDHLRGRLPSQYRARMGPNRPEVMTGGHGRQNVRTAPVPVDAPDAQGADEDVTMVDAGGQGSDDGRQVSRNHPSHRSVPLPTFVSLASELVSMAATRPQEDKDRQEDKRPRRAQSTPDDRRNQLEPPACSYRTSCDSILAIHSSVSNFVPQLAIDP